MSSLQQEIDALKHRWNELSCMLRLADNQKSNSEEQMIYTKAAFLMLCAHFEGGFFDTIRAMLDDINDAHIYSRVPQPLIDAHIKYTFLRNPDPDMKLVRRITDELSEQQVDLKIKDDFLNHASNLTPDVVRKCCKTFDVENIILTLTGSDFEIVFQNDSESAQTFLQNELRYMHRATKTFPYKINGSRHMLGIENKTPSLFADFLSDLIMHRNLAVHGSNADFEVPTLEEVHMDLLKIQALTLATIYCFGTEIQKI